MGAGAGAYARAGAALDLATVPTEVLEEELSRREQFPTEVLQAELARRRSGDPSQARGEGGDDSAAAVGQVTNDSAAASSSVKVRAKVKDLVKLIDADNDGRMSKAEVTKWLLTMGFSDLSSDVERAVDDMDANGDGTIQQEELERFMTDHFIASDVSGYGDCHVSAEVSAPDALMAGGVEKPAGCYSGITVVDLTRVLAGPYCTKMLAAHGARVIKVEVPVRGDDARFFGPFVNDESVYFQAVNGGKESIALNLKDEKDKGVLERLLETADMLVENFRPGVLGKLGFSWDSLHKRYPRLILVSISGYGQDGPCWKKPAYDAVVQGEGGIMSITGYEHTGPTRVGVSIGDTGAGLYAAIGAQAALFHRAQTGDATRVDVSMLDCQVALENIEMSSYLATGRVPGKRGSQHASIAPFQAFATQDADIMIAGGNDVLFKKIAQTLGHPEWAEAAKFKTNRARMENLEALVSEMTAALKIQPAEQWLAALEKAGVPSGPINSMDAVSRHEQVLSRNMIATMDHPRMGPIRVAGLPIKYTAFPDAAKLPPAPALDEHRDKVLAELLR